MNAPVVAHVTCFEKIVALTRIRVSPVDNLFRAYEQGRCGGRV